MTRDYDNRSQMPSSASTLHSPSPHPLFVFPSLTLSLFLALALFSPSPPPPPPSPPPPPPTLNAPLHPTRFRLLDLLDRLFAAKRASPEILLEHAHYTPILFVRHGCRVYPPPIALMPTVSARKRVTLARLTTMPGIHLTPRYVSCHPDEKGALEARPSTRSCKEVTRKGNERY